MRDSKKKEIICGETTDFDTAICLTGEQSK